MTGMIEEFKQVLDMAWPVIALVVTIVTGYIPHRA